MRNSIFKKLTSLIVAMCIVATLIPVAFADTTEVETTEPETLVYSFMASDYGISGRPTNDATSISYSNGKGNLDYYGTYVSSSTTNDWNQNWDGKNYSARFQFGYGWGDKNNSGTTTYHEYAAFTIKGIELYEYTVNFEYALHTAGTDAANVYILNPEQTAEILGKSKTVAQVINDSKVTPVFSGVNMYASSKGSASKTATFTPVSEGEHLLVFTRSKGTKNYKNVFPKILTLTPVVPEVEEKTYTFSATETGVTPGSSKASQVTSFSTWGWKYLDIDDISLSKNTHRVMQMHINDLRLALAGGKNTSGDPNYKVDSIQLALALQRPGASFYKASVKAQNSGPVQFYLSNFISETTPVESHMYDNMAFTKFAWPESAQKNIIELDKLVYSNGVNNLVFAINVSEKDKYVESLTLTPVEATTELKIDDTELLVAETATATLVASFTDENETTETMDVLNTFVTYDSTNKAVATVDANGQITALAKGKTTITATVDGEDVYEQNISVTTLDDAFSPEDTTEVQVPDDVTVNTYVYTVDGTKKELGVTTTVPVGTACEVDASTINGMEDYTFLYWAKGATMDRKQIVSGDAKYSFIPTIEATHLIAVFAPKDGDVTAKAEFYNGNGQLLTVKSEGTVTIPALPSMAGYGVATHWTLYGGSGEYKEGDLVALSGTMIFVAQYDDLAADITVTVTGGSCDKEEYEYGDVVTCTPEAEERFMCWKKDGVIVSMDTEYKFNAWEDCTVEAVYKDEYTFTGKATKLLIDIFNDKFIMAEFIGLSNYDETVVEKGIMIGNKCFALQKPSATQFTLEAESAEEAQTAVAYAIFDDGTMITDK